MKPGDTVWLWQLAFAGDDAALAAQLRDAGPLLGVWRALEGDEVRVQAARAAPEAAAGDWTSAVENTALRCTVQRSGASAGADAPWHYVVETDVLTEQEDDFNAWYEQEHLPGLAAVPGSVAAARFVRVAGSGPRYVASYDLASLDTYGSAAWLAVRATPWSSRVRPAFRNTRRTMYRRALHALHVLHVLHKDTRLPGPSQPYPLP